MRHSNNLHLELDTSHEGGRPKVCGPHGVQSHTSSCSSAAAELEQLYMHDQPSQLVPVSERVRSVLAATC